MQTQFWRNRSSQTPAKECFFYWSSLRSRSFHFFFLRTSPNLPSMALMLSSPESNRLFKAFFLRMIRNCFCNIWESKEVDGLCRISLSSNSSRSLNCRICALMMPAEESVKGSSASSKGFSGGRLVFFAIPFHNCLFHYLILLRPRLEIRTRFKVLLHDFLSKRLLENPIQAKLEWVLLPSGKTGGSRKQTSQEKLGVVAQQLFSPLAKKPGKQLFFALRQKKPGKKQQVFIYCKTVFFLQTFSFFKRKSLGS